MNIIAGFIFAKILDFDFSFPWFAVFAVTIITFIIAVVVSGSYPALKATKLDTIESLRYE